MVYYFYYMEKVVVFYLDLFEGFFSIEVKFDIEYYLFVFGLKKVFGFGLVYWVENFVFQV